MNDNKKYINLPTHILVTLYIYEKEVIERETLKKYLMDISSKLWSDNIVSSFDFNTYNDVLQSITFNRDINFLIDAGVIDWKVSDSVVSYVITKRGKEVVDSGVIYRGIPKDIIDNVKRKINVYILTDM